LAQTSLIVPFGVREVGANAFPLGALARTEPGAKTRAGLVSFGGCRRYVQPWRELPGLPAERPALTE
jgi:hypothetical protein